MSDNPFNLFQAPNKSRPYWVLPDINTVVKCLRIKGGSINSLLSACSEDKEDQDQISFLIQEELSKPENEKALKEWRKYILFNLKTKMLRGTDHIMEMYSHGSLEKYQFVKDLGKTISPDIFDPTKGGMGKEDEDEKALQAELSDLA